MYNELRNKAIAIIPVLESMQGVNDILRLKILKQLQRLVLETSQENMNKLEDQFLGLSKLQDLGNFYMKANDFIKTQGKESFENLLLTTPKSQLVSLFKKFQKSFTDEEYWDNLSYVYKITNTTIMTYTRNFSDLKELTGRS